MVPLALNESGEQLRAGMQRLVEIIGRLRPGITTTVAQGELDAIRKHAQASSASSPGKLGPVPALGSPSGQAGMVRIIGSGPPPGSPGAPPAMLLPPSDRSSGSRAQASAAGALSPNHEGHAEAPLIARAPQALEGAGAPKAMKPPGSPGPMGPPVIESKVVLLAEHLAGNLRPAMLTLLGMVGLVLLIACANVANLMLTRASARSREVAVRAVLGAGRWRLIRQLLAESVTLALVGGTAGLLLAGWAVKVITRLIPADIGAGILSVAPPRVDGNVLLFAFGVSAFTGILFGLAPALAAAHADLAERLKESAPAASAGGRRGWLRGTLAATELALALVLLIGAGLLMKSFYRLLSIDPGFAPERVLTMNVSLTDSRYPAPAQKIAFFTELLRRVGALPGVRSAAVADSLPLSPYNMMIRILTNHLPPSEMMGNENLVLLSRLDVSPAYFFTLGIPVLKGRTFTDQDNQDSLKVTVVNESLARSMWPGEDPIGKALPLMTENLTVIGVVGNTRHESLSDQVQSEFYVPYLQQPQGRMQLAVRTVADPSQLASAVRGEIAAINPEQPIFHVTTLEQTLADSVAPRRFNMLLLGIFAFIALTLATVGVYGVMAFAVTQRTHELGIRMALGADRRDVLSLVVRQGLRLTAVGVAAGLAGAWALSRFIAGFLYSVPPTDFVTYLVVSLALVKVSMLACYIPARRATRVDPMVALRYE